MSQLAKYWPTKEEINNCIKAEAETNDESLILAVHQPMVMSKRNLSNLDNNENCNEDGLLSYFLSNDYLSEGFLLVPITGISGAGKSHSIRWLNANLKRLDINSKKSYIIKIPKNASLKSVVERILEPLKGKDEYKLIYNDFQKATEEITEETAVIKFEAGLKLALKDKMNQIKSDLQISDNINKSILMSQLGFCNILPSLFSDIEIKKHFDNILLRIVLHSIKETGASDKNDFQFHPDDFHISDNIKISDSALQIQRFCQNQLENAEDRKRISDFCNSILDSAIQKTFKLHENLGGKTFQDIVLDIRRVLLREKKELILLIEDLVALTGIQEILLNICIQSAYEDGQQKYCFMRTAVAVTDGYFSGIDTIRTRIKYEFQVKSSFDSEGEILPHVINLVGSYLNAARYGENEIKKLYSNYNPENNKWIKPYINDSCDDQSEEYLKAFGISQQNYYLFPYNNRAIEQLVENKLKVGNKIIYNPRTIINYILREFLIENRDSFLNKTFPELNLNTSADISTLINKKISEKEKNRYRSFIKLWGGNPDREDRLKLIHPNLYKAFGLKPFYELSDYVEEPKLSFSTPLNNINKVDKLSDNKKKYETLIPIEIEHDKKWREWEASLDKWSNENISLSQEYARDIRNSVSKAIENYITWHHLFMKKRELKSTHIFIPNVSKGNPSENEILFKISETNKDESGNLRKSILAVVRAEENKWNFNYHEAQEDILYFKPFISKLADQVIEKFRKEANEEIKPLTQVLLFSSLLLGKNTYNLDEANISRLISLISEDISQPKEIKDMEKWNEIRNKYFNLYNTYKELLFDRFACFQGTGKVILSINNILFSQAIENTKLLDKFEDIKGKNYKYLLENEFKNNKDLIEYLHNSQINLSKSQAQKIKSSFIQWKNKLEEVIGLDFDKNILIDSIKKSVLVLKNSGNLWPDKFTTVEIDRVIKNFQELSVKEMLDNAKDIDNESIDNLKILYIATKFNSNTYQLSNEFLEKIPEFFKLVDKKIQNQIDMLNENDSESVKLEINEVITSLEINISKLEALK